MGTYLYYTLPFYEMQFNAEIADSFRAAGKKAEPGLHACSPVRTFVITGVLAKSRDTENKESLCSKESFPVYRELEVLDPRTLWPPCWRGKARLWGRKRSGAALQFPKNFGAVRKIYFERFQARFSANFQPILSITQASAESFSGRASIDLKYQVLRSNNEYNPFSLSFLFRGEIAWQGKVKNKRTKNVGTLWKIRAYTKQQGKKKKK